jgi:ribA/ribD-fused uncharacterized protein
MNEIWFFKRDRARYEWLSNFYPINAAIRGRVYQTVEHFFQASKATTEAHHEGVRVAPTARDAKRLGKKVLLRPDWEQVKEEVMLEALRVKFALPLLRQQLLETGDALLVEDSPFDSFWGAGRKGNGQNRLGKLLMRVRAEIRAQTPPG